MILMLAPAANMNFASLPSGSTYVSDANGLVYVANNSVADQLAIVAAGCKTLTPIPGGIVTQQTGTAYTVQPTDQGNIIEFTNASAVTVTLPSGLPVGFVVQLLQAGSGQVSAVAGSGTALVTPNVATTPNQYSLLYCVVIQSIIGPIWDVISEPIPTGGIIGATTAANLYTQDSSAHYAQYTIAQVFNDQVSFTGTISGSVLTASSVTGTFAVGQTLSYSGAPAGLTISSFGSGTGGAGTYNLSSAPGNVSSGIAMTASGTGQWLKTGTGNGSGNWTQETSITLQALSATVTTNTSNIATNTAAIANMQPVVTDLQFTLTPNSVGNLPLIDAGNGLWWTELLLDTNRKIIWGAKSDGSHWIANGTASLVQIVAPYISGGVAVIVAPTLSNTALADLPLMDAGSGLFWLNFLLDANRKIVWGTKSDGSIWEAQGGSSLVQITQPASSAPTYSTDTNFTGPSSPHTNGVYGTLTSVPSNPNLLDMHIGIGQSWDLGENSASYDTTFDITPLDGTNCLMPGQGPVPAGATITSLVALYEHSSSPTIETWCSRAGHAIQNGFSAAGLAGPKQAFVISARGGTPYIGIKRGTTTYQQLLTYVQQIKSIAAGMGLTLRVRSIVTLHGESDANATLRDEYANDLVALRRDLDSDIRTITGQLEPLILITHQCCDETVTSGNADPNATLAAADTMDLDQAHCLVSHPAYSIGPQDNAGGPNAGGHWMAMGYVQIGEQIGHTILKAIYGAAHKPRKLLRGAQGAYWASTSSIQLTYNGPVFIDSSNAIVDSTQLSAYGFTFADGSGSPPTISSVTQNAAGSSIAVSGNNVTINSCATGEAIVIVYGGVTYGITVDSLMTPTEVAAGFAAAIPGASAVSGVLTLPGAPTSATCYSNRLLVTLSGTPSYAPTLRYACQATGAAGVGNQTGERGCIRSPYSFALSAIARGSVTFLGNPAVNDTVTVNGVTITFVSSGATGNQVNIGANAAATALALWTFLSGATSNSSLNVLRFSMAASGTGVLLYAAAAASIALSKSSSAIAVTNPAAIPLYDWALAQRVDLPPV